MLNRTTAMNPRVLTRMSIGPTSRLDGRKALLDLGRAADVERTGMDTDAAAPIRATSAQSFPSWNVVQDDLRPRLCQAVTIASPSPWAARSPKQSSRSDPNRCGVTE